MTTGGILARYHTLEKTVDAIGELNANNTSGMLVAYTYNKETKTFVKSTKSFRGVLQCFLM